MRATSMLVVPRADAMVTVSPGRFVVKLLYRASASGSSVKDCRRTSPLMPWGAPMRPMSRRLSGAPEPTLLGRSGFRRRGSGFGGLGLGLGAFGRLLAGQRLLGVAARRTLEHAGGIEETQHAIGRLRPDSQPMLGALGEQVHALAGIGQLRIIGADLLDEAAVPRRAGVGDDDIVVGALLGAGAGETKFQGHSSFLGLI